MAELVCVACARPITPTDDSVTIEQVDACTMAVERATYHATCRDQPAGPATRETPAMRRPRQPATGD